MNSARVPEQKTINPYHMTRLFLFLVLLLSACNNSGSEGSSGNDSSATTNQNWPKDKENVLLNDCVEELKSMMREDSAFTRCNCVLRLLRADYPNIDSAESAMRDSTAAARYAARCL